MRRRLTKHAADVVLLFGLLTQESSKAQLPADSRPDPVVLLQGVESSRLQIPASSLEIRYAYRSPTIAAEGAYSVDFDGDRRRFVAKSESGLKHGVVYDGTKAIVYNGILHQAEVRALSNPDTGLFFDPRLLGINSGFFWDYSIESCLPYRNAAKVGLIGQELVGDKPAWHVRLSFVEKPSLKDYLIDIWIDASNGFRVYRYDQNGLQMYSTFENNEYPWLPSRVVVKEYNNKGDVVTQTECEILHAKANVAIPPATWTLAGLQIPDGTPVLDLVNMKTKGFWYSRHGIVSTPMPTEVSAVGSTRARVLVWLACALSTAILLLVIVRSRVKRA